MLVKKLIIPLGFLFAIGSAQAQISANAYGYYEDALLFSQTSAVFGSTARIQGIGGAQTSLGADMSMAGSNPAGLGMFNKSVISFTPNLNFNNTDASYFGNNSSTFRNNFSFANLGLVYNSNKGDFTEEKFKGGSFAVSIQRTNNFTNELLYQGRNPNNSIVDTYVADANAGFLDGEAGTAYDQFLIENADGYLYFTDNTGRTYIYPAGDFDGYTSLVGATSFDGFLPEQSERIRTKGNQTAVNMAWGGNYDDRLYFGGGLSFETLDYNRVRTFEEYAYQDANGNQDDLVENFRVRNELTITGTGINFNAGLIVRPVDFITLGVNYKSPTYYNLNEELGYRMTTQLSTSYSYFDGVDANNDSTYFSLGRFTDLSDLSITDYSLRTPAKINAGATVFLGKIGFISGDVEFVDYAKSQLRSNDFSAVGDNQTIKALYTNTINYRLGAEMRLDNFRFRGGYAFFADPYAGSTFDQSRQNITFGVGFRQRDYFVDLAVVNSQFKSLYSPYFAGNDTPVVEFDKQTTSASITLGFNF